MTCNAKHTRFQPADEDWKCPKCGAHSPDFHVDETPDWECEDLHVEDVLQCERCEYECSGRAFAAQVQKAKHQVTCPTCKGRGFVTKKGHR